MSKQLERMIAANATQFESWHTEIDGYGESHNDHLPSYWVYCKPGFIIPDMECGTIHTKTVTEALALMKTVEAGCYINGHSSPHNWVTSSEFDTVVRKCEYCGEKRRIK